MTDPIHVSAPCPPVVRGWRPDPETRLLHDAWGNAPDLLSPADAARLEAGDWRRADGNVPCVDCGSALWRHGMVLGALWLVRDCRGDLFKL